MKNVRYRIANERDICEICRFRVMQLSRNGEVKVEGIDDELYEFYKSCFKQNMIYQIFATLNDEVIATGAVLFYSYPPSHVNKTGKIAYISNMFTLPEFRHQGIATHILTMLEDEARRRGITNAKLGATKMGKSLYEHNGYIKDELHTLVKKL